MFRRSIRAAPGARSSQLTPRKGQAVQHAGGFQDHQLPNGAIDPNGGDGLELTRSATPAPDVHRIEGAEPERTRGFQAPQCSQATRHDRRLTRAGRWPAAAPPGSDLLLAALVAQTGASLRPGPGEQTGGPSPLPMVLLRSRRRGEGE